jgi:carboxypeptidase C (cathepsin A)
MFRGLGGVTLKEREAEFKAEQEDALNNNATVVYLEAPSGVGFSRRAVRIAPNWTYYDTAFEVRDAIVKYFEKFPEFKGNDVYIAGEGWTGVVVPRVIELFHLDKQSGKEAGNLKIKGTPIL